MSGTLYLIPVPLGDTTPEAVLPASVIERIRPLNHFVVENAKSARAFLKRVGTLQPLQSLRLEELNEHTPPNRVQELLAPLLAGNDLGLLSEAGCPAVADPGAELVALAQKAGIRVAPLVGPSSLLLGLMASGLNGQRFAFLGYLPSKPLERAKVLREVENESRKYHQTQIFIETPYRNRQMLETILGTCQDSTRLTLAMDLTVPGEQIITLSVAEWKKRTPPDLDRRPTVFLLLA